MLLRTWHHGHSIGLGALLGLAIYGAAPYLLVVAGFAFGVGATCLVVGAYRLVRFTRAYLMARAYAPR